MQKHKMNGVKSYPQSWLKVILQMLNMDYHSNYWKFITLLKRHSNGVPQHTVFKGCLLFKNNLEYNVWKCGLIQASSSSEYQIVCGYWDLSPGIWHHHKQCFLAISVSYLTKSDPHYILIISLLWFKKVWNLFNS